MTKNPGSLTSLETREGHEAGQGQNQSRRQFYPWWWKIGVFLAIECEWVIEINMCVMCMCSYVKLMTFEFCVLFQWTILISPKVQHSYNISVDGWEDEDGVYTF